MIYLYLPHIGKAFDDISRSSALSSVKIEEKYVEISQYLFKVMETTSSITQMNEMIIPFLFIPFTLYSVYVVFSTSGTAIKSYFSLFFFIITTILFTSSMKDVFPQKTSTYEELLPANQVVLDSLFMTSVYSIALFLVYTVFFLSFVKFSYKPNSFFLFSSVYFFFLCQIKAGLILYYLYYCCIPPIELAILLDTALEGRLK